ncbi:hypothetical protein J416_11702 [Gracilibacillus halophilus YIM-C55.5]|uniref:RsgI N-terminal anti-sigma domain-containing protein n=1 Tax=Gracilibacillus halophilus YIM-C55.5 TaxID=1308866 RepID=N4WAH4_9BACI|nr:hypothetical protein [Gracilibacillus halophilus]ENH96279.1 hypothetical protein J416_11702 [Gracilibacillus halophilus YIM-C55.5]
MKKGIIVEHKRRYSIVMDRKGLFHKAKPLKQEQIGVEVSFEPYTPLFANHRLSFLHARWKMASMVLVCLVLFMPIYFWLEQDEVYAVVSIDINPSINLVVNDDLEVVQVETMNKDAEAIVDQIDWKKQSVLATTNHIIEASRETFHIVEDQPVLMAVSYISDHEKNESMLTELSAAYRKMKNPIAIYEVPPSIRDQAETEQVSMNQVTASSMDSRSKDDTTEGNEKENESDSLSSLDEQDRELIQNFYNDSDDDEENTSSKTSDDDQSVNEKNQDESVTPSSTLPKQANEKAHQNQNKSVKKNRSHAKPEANGRQKSGHKKNQNDETFNKKSMKKHENQHHPSNRGKGKKKGHIKQQQKKHHHLK